MYGAYINAPIAPSDSRLGRRLSQRWGATLAHDGSHPITRTNIPTCAARRYC